MGQGKETRAMSGHLHRDDVRGNHRRDLLPHLLSAFSAIQQREIHITTLVTTCGKKFFDVIMQNIETMTGNPL